METDNFKWKPMLTKELCTCNIKFEPATMLQYSVQRTIFVR